MALEIHGEHNEDPGNSEEWGFAFREKHSIKLMKINSVSSEEWHFEIHEEHWVKLMKIISLGPQEWHLVIYTIKSSNFVRFFS